MKKIMKFIRIYEILLAILFECFSFLAKYVIMRTIVHSL